MCITIFNGLLWPGSLDGWYKYLVENIWLHHPLRGRTLTAFPSPPQCLISKGNEKQKNNVNNNNNNNNCTGFPCQYSRRILLNIYLVTPIMVNGHEPNRDLRKPEHAQISCSLYTCNALAGKLAFQYQAKRLPKCSNRRSAILSTSEKRKDGFSC